MCHFFMMKNPEGTYHIEVEFTVYYEQFHHYPEWLTECQSMDPRCGYQTQFNKLVEDDLPEEVARQKVSEYRKRYDALLDELEADDTRWNEFPFQGKENYITFCK